MVTKNSIKTSTENKYSDTVKDTFTFEGKIGLPVKGGIIYIPICDIVRIESDGGYSTFYTVDNKKYLISKYLKIFENILPSTEFFRTHKSHLINTKKVKKYIRTDGSYVEMEGGSIVKISRRKKDKFLKTMNLLN